jgi:hypothetical protein
MWKCEWTKSKEYKNEMKQIEKEYDLQKFYFTLNYETYEKINSDSINNILENKDKKISTQYHRITRDTKTKELFNKIETKEFGFVYDKRVILENVDTKPFGY